MPHIDRRTMKLFKTLSIALILWLSLVGIGQATTYTIGPGQDHETFTALMAAHTLAAGDIVDGGGNTFREEWHPNGTGAVTLQNAKIFGSTQLTTWTTDTDPVWKCTYAATPRIIWFIRADDSTIHWGHRQTSKANCVNEYDFYSDGSSIWVYAATDPDTRYTSIEAGTRQIAVHASRNSVTLSNLEVAYSADSSGVSYAINVLDYSGWVIDGCTIHHIGIKNGGGAEGVYFRKNVTSGTVQNCTIHNTGNHGVSVYADGGDNSGVIIQNNTFYDSYHSMVDIQSPNAGTVGLSGNGVIVRYNRFYNTTDLNFVDRDPSISVTEVGALFVLGKRNSTEGINYAPKIYYNIFYNLQASAIGIRDDVRNAEVYNNTMYGTHPTLAMTYAGAIYVSTLGNGYVPSGTIIKNNIGMDTGQPLYVQVSTYVSEVDYNLWYRSAGGTAEYVKVANTSYHYDDFAAYKAATGWDTNGKWEDPHFVSTSDFHLTAGSPAIDTGIDVGLSRDYEGTTVPQNAVPDMGAYESMGTVPTITNVTSELANGSYGVGQVVDIDVTFSEAVTSTGNVTVTLETGTTDRTCTFTVEAATTGTCNYTVQAGDESLDLTVLSIAGTIKNVGNVSMTNFTPAVNLAANKAIVIDAVPPTIQAPNPTGAQGCTSDPRTVTATVTTTEAATCRISTTDQTYSDMGAGKNFGTTGGTSHSNDLTGLACNAAYTRYVRCSDALANVSAASTLISFSIGVGSVPGVSLGLGGGSSTITLVP
jgi:hypothetical protein